MLAKEKDFNEQCLAYYRLSFVEDQEPFLATELEFFLERYDNHNFRLNLHPSVGGVAICTAPTHQQLIDWFRDKHFIHISPKHSTFSQTYGFKITGKYDADSNGVLYNNTFGKYEYYEMLNIAFKEAFKLI